MVDPKLKVSRRPRKLSMDYGSRFLQTEEKDFEQVVGLIAAAIKVAAENSKGDAQALASLESERALFEEQANKLRTTIGDLPQPRQKARFFDAVTEALFQTARIASMADRRTIADWGERRRAAEMRNAKKTSDEEKARRLDDAILTAAKSMGLPLARSEKFAMQVRPEVLKILGITEAASQNVWPSHSTLKAAVTRLPAQTEQEFEDNP